MSIIKGLFDGSLKFTGIEMEDLQKWLQVKEDRTILENRLGNRILYSQTIAQNKKELLLDFAIIRKIIEQNQAKFYNKNLRKINIPEVFNEHFPDLQKLVGIFIDVIMPNGITALFIESDQSGRKQIGTYIRPDNLQAGGCVIICVKNQQYKIDTGRLVIIPVPESRVDIVFTSATAKLIGKKILSVEVIGGKMGLIIDTRIL